MEEEKKLANETKENSKERRRKKKLPIPIIAQHIKSSAMKPSCEFFWQGWKRRMVLVFDALMADEDWTTLKNSFFLSLDWRTTFWRWVTGPVALSAITFLII